MIEHGPDEFPAGLPPELAALDAELDGLRIEERASFGPELEAELRGAWARPGRPAAPLGRRWLAAACLATLFVAAGVPPARASLVALIGRIQVVVEPERDASPAPRPAEPAPAEAAPPEVPPAAPVAVDPAEVTPFRTARVTFPSVLDVEAQQQVIRRFYPRHLQDQRTGGTVNVLVWLDSTGVVSEARLQPPGSGIPELDRAAVAAAPLLRFAPATRDGRPVGTWAEFDIVFAPEPGDVPAVERPELTDGERPRFPPEWTGHAVVPAPTLQEARQLLAAALEEEADLGRLGSLDRLIEGEPAPGTDPMEWRSEATLALERALAHAPDNPAPFLALARIRRKQGLRADARGLLERGIQRAARGGGTISPRLTAELHYELATVARESWRAAAHVGGLPAAALPAGSCPRAGRAARGGQAAVETLIAWSYLCPLALDRALEAGFVLDDPGEGDREAMRRSLVAAVAADGGHVGANVELLLDLAEHADWWGLLNGARRFAWGSGGHPFASLLSGLALQRLGRAEEALEDLETGLAGLSPEEAARIRDLGPLLDAEAARRLGALSGAKRAAAEADFWAPLDPIASTSVNERRVEHLARAAFAHLRLGGSRTDAGEVWVRYGAPRRIRALAEGSALRTEMWDYGQGPDVAFRRPATSPTRDLTDEARAYLDDLRATLPHAYGTQGRSVAALAVQVTRFRAPAGGVEVEVQARVPEALLGADDTVEVALVQLGARGERVALDRERIPARAVTVPLRARAHPEAVQLVMEMYNPALERVAGARFPVERADGGSDPRMSDLQLTAPVTRTERAVERGAPWILPLAEERVEGAEVGVLFELYDLPREGYRLRVELVDEQGRGREVPFRAAARDGTDPAATRLPWPDAERTIEYLVASLADVAPGRHRLRVVAELGDGRERVSERVIERR